MQVAVVMPDPAVRRDPVQISVGQESLRQRTEGYDPDSSLFCSLFQSKIEYLR